MKSFDINKIQLNIQSPQTNISKPLNNYIMNNIEKLGKTFERIEKCNVVFKAIKSDENKNFEISVAIIIPGHSLFATEKKENPRLSVQLAFDDLRKQLVRVKEKRTGKTKSS